MKTLKEAVAEAVKNRASERHKDGENFRLMITALAIPPKEQATGTSQEQFLYGNGIKLRHDFDSENRTISLRFYGSSKIHTLTVECMPTGFRLSNENGETDLATLEEALTQIANWYLNVKEKYS